MKRVLLFVACALMFPGTVLADIYQSKDDDGNPVFSDQQHPDAKEVTLSEQNLAEPLVIDSKQEQKPAKESGLDVSSKAESSATAEDETKKPNFVVLPNRHNEELKADALRDSRNGVQDAEEREVDSESGERREVEVR